MQTPKLKVLIEAGGVREVTVSYNANADGWTVQVRYATRTGERLEVLERQRGGVRVFATLDAAANALDEAGIDEFCVNRRSGEGSSDDR